MTLTVALLLTFIPLIILGLRRAVRRSDLRISPDLDAKISGWPWDIINATLIICLLIGITGLFFKAIGEARADGWPFEESPVIFMGAQYELGSQASVFCHAQDGNWVGNLGVEQTVFSSRNFEIDLNYTHHSCAFEEDDVRDYDAVGASLRFKFWE